MQIYSELYQNHSTLFDAFLEELSERKNSPVPEDDPIQYLSGDFQEENSSSKLSDTELIWGTLEDPLSAIQPEESLSVRDSMDQEGEIQRVTSSREDQESKVSDYLTHIHQAWKKHKRITRKECPRKKKGHHKGKVGDNSAWRP